MILDGYSYAHGVRTHGPCVLTARTTPESRRSTGRTNPSIQLTDYLNVVGTQKFCVPCRMGVVATNGAATHRGPRRSAVWGAGRMVARSGRPDTDTQFIDY